MSDVLNVIAAPRNAEESRTKRLAAEFFAAYRSEHPGEKITRFDLFERELPRIDGIDVNTKFSYGAGEELSGEQERRQRHVEELIEPLRGNDKLVITAPMWNFNVPWVLKRWIDAVVWPGETFEYTESGPQGLLTGTKALVISSKGGIYDEGDPRETNNFFTGYLDWICEWIGITDVSYVSFEGTDSLSGEDYEAAFDEAKASAREVARQF